MRDASAQRPVASAWKRTLKRIKGSYFDWLAGMLVLILIRLAALSPLLTLVLSEKGSALRYLSLLTPVLYFFLVLPLRFSMGEAMEHALDGGSFTTARLVRLNGYNRKLRAVLLQALHLLPWALPLLLGLGAGWYMWRGVEDGTAVFRMVRSLGKVLGEQYGIMEGFYIVAAFGGLLLLVLLYGMMRNGMLRFLYKKSGGNYALARKEMLSRLKGRRGGQFLAGLVHVLLTLPMLLINVYLGYRMYRVEAIVPDLAGYMLLSFFVIYLLLPLHKVLQAYYIRLPEDDK